LVSRKAVIGVMPGSSDQSGSTVGVVHFRDVVQIHG
jgi:hypothetical protein